MSEVETDWVFDVGEADFGRAVVEESRRRPVVVDFWAPWCGPCRVLGPLLERLVAERRGAVVLAKVDIEVEQNLAAQFRIESIPAVQAFRDGRPVLGFVGALPEAQIRAFLDRISHTEAESAALNAADPVAAEKAYRDVLQEQPNHDEARLGLARALLAQGRTDEVLELLEPIGSEGPAGQEAAHLRAVLRLRQAAQPFGDEAAARSRLAANPHSAQAHFELGCVLAAAERYPEALEHLIAAAESDYKLATGRVREIMVEVFYALGADHPLANEYRAKLTRVLY
jgi:putative thioredoxin